MFFPQFIPDDSASLGSSGELSRSCLDQLVPPTPVLDNSLAREKVMLVHRGTLARRKNKGKLNKKSTNIVKDGSSLPSVNDALVIVDNDTMVTQQGSHCSSSDFQEELQKKILNGISVIKSTELAGT